MRARYILGPMLLTVPMLTWADDARVAVASLTVKERLQSIEQINVTAEKPLKDIKPESKAVAELLELADELEQAAEPAQSASH